jgi:hypothetical protein
MGKGLDELRGVVGRVPWLTSKGLDLAEFPIDGVLKEAVGRNEEEFSNAVSLLQTMHRAGRTEAGVFLLGLLAHSGDDWKRRTEIVEGLEGFNTPECAQFLFGELERVKSNNTTRRYLGAVLKVLAGMPRELVQSKLLRLTADNRFSPRIRDKFVEALDKVSRR